MGKVHIGVTAVGGHKLWGVVGGGRLTVGGGKLRAGHARPLQGGEREIVGRPALRPPRTCMGAGMVSGHLCRGRRPRRPAEGSRPLPTMWKVRGWLWKARGPGMPGPYGVVEGWAGAGREGEVGEVTGHCCVCCRIRSKISLRILCKSRILLL